MFLRFQSKNPSSHLGAGQIGSDHHLSRGKTCRKIKTYLIVFLKDPLKYTDRNGIDQAILSRKSIENIRTFPQQRQHSKYISLITIFHNFWNIVLYFSEIDKTFFDNIKMIFGRLSL